MTVEFEISLYSKSYLSVDHIVVIVDKVHWIFVVRADKIKPLFTPKV
jgi:hypothetical protein